MPHERRDWKDRRRAAHGGGHVLADGLEPRARLHHLRPAPGHRVDGSDATRVRARRVQGDRHRDARRCCELELLLCLRRHHAHPVQEGCRARHGAGVPVRLDQPRHRTRDHPLSAPGLAVHARRMDRWDRAHRHHEPPREAHLPNGPRRSRPGAYRGREGARAPKRWRSRARPGGTGSQTRTPA